MPLFEGGLIAKLIYGDEPRIIDNLDVPEDDPAAEYLAGHHSLDGDPDVRPGRRPEHGHHAAEGAVVPLEEELPELVWLSNLFGRATSNLVLSEELRRSNQALHREMKVVGEIQRSLLPARLAKIPTLDLATYYQPSQRAGGDYYDFFPLLGGKWGIFIADVSGHGAPAAVLMAVTHCIAHTNPGQAQPPAQVLDYLNRHLATLYTSQNENLITAFYGVYDPADRTLTYACAGHPPPRLKRCQDGTLLALDRAGGFPLGITSEGAYDELRAALQPGDQIIFYTDGITEAGNPEGKLFGTDRLDHLLENCSLQPRPCSTRCCVP